MRSRLAHCGTSKQPAFAFAYDLVNCHVDQEANIISNNITRNKPFITEFAAERGSANCNYNLVINYYTPQSRRYFNFCCTQEH